MDVKIYTTPYCVWCGKTKDLFKAKKVKYKEIDVSKNMKSAQEMIKLSGQRGVPVIVVNNKVVVGYDEDRLKKLLKTK